MERKMRAAPEAHRDYVVRGVRVRVPNDSGPARGAGAPPESHEMLRSAHSEPRRNPPRRALADQVHEWRVLIAEPGVRRRLPASAFRAGDGVPAGANVACTVQLFEATAPQRRAELAASIRRATGESAPLQPLTAALAAQVGLTPAFRTYRPPRALWREPDVVLPGERFVQVRVRPREALRSSNEATCVQRNLATARHAAVGPRGIPPRYMRPWEFQLSRTEALFDMRHHCRPGLMRRLLDRIGRRARLARWRALLDGHTALEQLWGVRPPKRGYQDPEINAWARRMLAAAGYDAERWLPTWELFWRRKGV
jgi:hypothetical protein